MKVAIIGNGRIGRAVHRMWPKSTIFETDNRNIPPGSSSVQYISGPEDTKLREYDVWVVATPYTENISYAKEVFVQEKIYIDFTESVEVTDNVKSLASLATAKGLKSLFISQCGLAPGWVNIVANGLALRFDQVEKINIRVGALPISVNNPLRYNITWSAEGVANEYMSDCKYINKGAVCGGAPLSGLEQLIINGEEFEAFRTSGGIGSLILSWHGTQGIQEVEYKTLRYPGHLQNIHNIIQSREFALGSRLVANGICNPDVKHIPYLTEYLKQNCPQTKKDRVVVFIEIIGTKDGQLWSESMTADFRCGQELTAIQKTTALGAIVWLEEIERVGIENIHKHNLGKNFLKQESVPLDTFMKTLNNFRTNVEKTL